MSMARSRGRYYAVAALIGLSLVLALSSGVRAASAEKGVGPYPPLSAIYAELQALAAAHPDLVKLEVIGSSVEGRPLYALHVGRQDGKTRPEALLFANIHAEEVISSQVCLAVARRLLNDHQDPWIASLLDRTDFWIIPVLNPDGYNRVISTGGQGGQGGTRKNARGVDLNRNFPLAPGAHSRHPLAGNHRPRSSYYMGSQPLSEPETRALADLAGAHHFYVSISEHSVAGKFLYPHCFTKVPARHQPEFKEVGAAFVSHQPTWKYKVENSYGWYPTLGDADDFLYMQNGVFAFTVEHGTVAYNLKYALWHWPIEFWTANPRDPERWAKNDADAILAAVEKALEITGGQPRDPAAGRPVETN